MRNNHLYFPPKPRRFSSRWRLKAYKVLAIILGVIFLSYFIIVSRLSQQESLTEQFNSREYSRGQRLTEEPLCKLPLLPIDDPDLMKYLKKVDPITCNLADGSKFDDWLFVNGSHALLTVQAQEQYGPGITCQFSDLARINDLNTKISEQKVEGQSYEFKDSDFVHATCSSKSSSKKWASFLAAPRSNVQATNPKPLDELPNKDANSKPNPVRNGEKDDRLSVLMWGHDSLSRNMFMRKLPLAFSYLTEKLDGVILKGYNIVGDGTPQALIPILTGKTELELPETRKRKGNSAHYVNIYPFVWKDYEAQGYLTGYMEDCPSIGTFQYRLKGFNEPPTHFYMRPYFVLAEHHYSNYPRYCIGSTPRHKVMMDYVRNIMQTKKRTPKFLFSFHSELSHGDVNTIEGADLDFSHFLQQLNSSGALNSTILIVMSDHGSRFSEIRESQQGKQEERMPMFMFVFPKWFKTKYSIAYNNFLRNSHILSTPFDIHATLVDILNLTRLSDEHFLKPNEMSERQMSLFRPVPPNRSCKDAKIDPHWCACLQWHILNVSLPIVQQAAHTFVNYVNEFVTNQTSSSSSASSSSLLCAPLQLSHVLWAANLLPTKEMVHFKQNADVDGFLPDLTDKMVISKSTIQLQLETVPGYGRFEVSLTHDLQSNTFQTHESEVSRINKYGSQAVCVENSLEHLRKYCYCNSMPDPDGALKDKDKDKGGSENNKQTIIQSH